MKRVRQAAVLSLLTSVALPGCATNTSKTVCAELEAAGVAKGCREVTDPPRKDSSKSAYAFVLASNGSIGTIWEPKDANYDDLLEIHDRFQRTGYAVYSDHDADRSVLVSVDGKVSDSEASAIWQLINKGAAAAKDQKVKRQEADHDEEEDEDEDA